MLKLCDSTTGWLENEEYIIVGTDTVLDSSGNTRVILYLNREINPNCIDGGVIPGNICKYIINKHLPDETNLILRYSPKDNIIQDGLVFPQYIDEVSKNNSGNTVKSLRAQNLLPYQKI
jgi:hypothetical protein